MNHSRENRIFSPGHVLRVDLFQTEYLSVFFFPVYHLCWTLCVDNSSVTGWDFSLVYRGRSMVQNQTLFCDSSFTFYFNPLREELIQIVGFVLLCSWQFSVTVTFRQRWRWLCSNIRCFCSWAGRCVTWRTPRRRAPGSRSLALLPSCLTLFTTSLLSSATSYQITKGA